jgi:YVTN family beta-propeller protein
MFSCEDRFQNRVKQVLTTNYPVVAALFLSIAAAFPSPAQVPLASYVNFEGAQTNPVRLSADGTRLFAVNTPNASLSVFDVSTGTPTLIAEIPVGIEPVSVYPRSNDEAWVVNQVSDSISVVSVSRRLVTDTIQVKDEPADILVGGSYAIVSVARSNELQVFLTSNHQLVKHIPLQGANPRALTITADGKTVYVAFALSGNRTTVVPSRYSPAQPSPTNPALPTPPRVSLIVDATAPEWSSVIKYSMPDNDVAVIDTATLTVSRYYSRVGTVNLGIAVVPTTGDLFVTNTDSRNLTFYEPALRGHWVDNRLTRIQKSGQITAYDLNPNLDYATLPNPAALATAISQPAAVVPAGLSGNLFVASFGTDRVARVNSNGVVLQLIEIGPNAGSAVDPTQKRGPRGLAFQSTFQRLYVLNRISNTISVVDTSSGAVLQEMRVGFDPTPSVIRTGRGFLYDAKLSGNGTGSCASCHIDGDMDHLDWNLGDPGGQMNVVVQQGKTFNIHPMKGPMLTQTLRGLTNTSPYHWRGDKADLTAFNPAFDSLMGGPQLPTSQMASYVAYLNTITYMPNPNVNLDGTLPATLAGGDPNAGRNTFINDFAVGTTTCNSCHFATPGPGSNRGIIQGNGVTIQPTKVAQLRNLYQRTLFNATPGAASIDGFGFFHDGNQDSLMSGLDDPARFPNFAGNIPLLQNLVSFLLCFDTGTPPAVGHTITVTPANITNVTIQADWATLQQLADAGAIDLITKGAINGAVHGLLYQPDSHTYKSDTTGSGPYTQAQLQTYIAAGKTISVMGVPLGSGTRMGIDRDLNGVLDGDQ